MKVAKILAALVMLVVLSVSFSVTVFAAERTVEYYDEDGNAIAVNGLYYNSDGNPMFNASCYYLDEDGNSVYVGGCRAYYYNQNGGLTAGSYYYDQDGNAVARPASYRGGYGCGMWYYDAQGNVVDETVYYDDFGNPVDPPANTQPPVASNGGWGRGCCGRW